jgi:RNA polymerase sigma factor (TIGR02999 family)
MRRLSEGLPPSEAQYASAPQTTVVTELLVRWRAGDNRALESLMPLVYDELRRLAHRYLSKERVDHTLQSAALVHEAYLQLAGHQQPLWQDRAHFFGIAARLMRQILVQHARAHKASKRGGAACKLTLNDALDQAEAADIDVMALDDALQALDKLDHQQSRVVELRFFAGISIEESAEVLGISASTVKRDWNRARVWLYRELDRSA